MNLIPEHRDEVRVITFRRIDDEHQDPFVEVYICDEKGPAHRISAKGVLELQKEKDRYLDAYQTEKTHRERLQATIAELMRVLACQVVR